MEWAKKHIENKAKITDRNKKLILQCVLMFVNLCTQLHNILYV